MTITDLKVSVILSHSGHKNGKRKKVTDRKSVGELSYAGQNRSLIVSVVKQSVTVHKHSDYKL